jgi:hypothetical protein
LAVLFGQDQGRRSGDVARLTTGFSATSVYTDFIQNEA